MVCLCEENKTVDAMSLWMEKEMALGSSWVGGTALLCLNPNNSHAPPLSFPVCVTKMPWIQLRVIEWNQLPIQIMLKQWCMVHKKWNCLVNLCFKPEKQPDAIYFLLPSLCFWEMKQRFLPSNAFVFLCSYLSSSCWQKIIEFCFQTSELLL